MGVSSSVEVVHLLASRLNCKVGKLPFLYLRLPIGAKSKFKAVWDPIVVSFECKLSS